MEARAPGEGLSELSHDLILLAVRSRNGSLMVARRLAFGLMGAELVRLAVMGRVEILQDRIVVRVRTATGDSELDAALSTLTDTRRPPRPAAWVSIPRRAIRSTYLDRLIDVDMLRMEHTGLLGTARYRITATEHAQLVRSRLDIIAQPGSQAADIAQAALGGLVSAIGLDRFLYPGAAGRAYRTRLAEVAAGHWTIEPPGEIAPAVAASVRAAVHAVSCALRNEGTHDTGGRSADAYGGAGPPPWPVGLD